MGFEDGKYWKNALSWIKRAMQRKYVQGMLVLALLWWAYTAHAIMKDKQENKIEVENQKDPLAFWNNNEDFFTKNFELKTEVIAQDVEVIRDVCLTFYVVKKWDTLDGIRRKLMKLEEFSYLQRAEYDRTNPNTKTTSFNIPNDNLKVWMLIPIPIDSKVRVIEDQDFVNYCYEAIDELKASGWVYTKQMNEILSYASKDEIVAMMLAFSRSETSSDYTNFTWNIGDTELHRWEPTYRAFSFTYFHILMEKNSDGTTAWPWLAARNKLWLTEGQCYHPKNAAKLFIGYWIEKKGKELNKIFPLTDKNIARVGAIYNWSYDYAPKLEANYAYAEKFVAGEIHEYDNTNLEKYGFIYKWLNKDHKPIYEYKTPENIHTIDDLKKTTATKFNLLKDKNAPKVTEENIVNRKWKPIIGTVVPDRVFVVLN